MPVGADDDAVVPIIDRLAGEIAKFTSAPETRAKLIALALEPLTGSTPDSFAAYVRSEVERWTPIVKASGATLE
jgi:tripartite-type tricarboxylate transporter receptor subunit TctC